MSFRFEFQGVEDRGYPVAHFWDTVTKQHVYVYRKNGRYRLWNKYDDRLVENRTLRMEARDALNGRSRQEAA